MATGLEVTVKVAVVAFAATVTLAGTWAAAVLLLDRVTTAPPAGAGPSSVTVPVDELPPRTELGLKLTALSTAAVTVKVAFWVLPYVPETFSEVSLATGLVVAVKVAVVVFAASVTLAGTWAAAALLLDSITVAPPAGAGPLRVMVPVDEFPPRTEAGLRLMEFSTAVVAVTVKLAFCVPP